MHVYVRIRPEHGFKDVRRAALAFAREVERRTDDVTTTWWRKDRDPRRSCSWTTTRTPATTPSRRRTRCAATPRRRCRPRSRWDEVDDVEPRDCTIATVPARYAEIGDLHAGIDDAVFDLAPLLEWADRDERDGQPTTPEPEPEG